MVCATYDGCRAHQLLNQAGHTWIYSRSPQLGSMIAPPTPHPFLLINGERMIVPCTDGHNGWQAFNFDGRRNADGHTTTSLLIVVPTPSPNGTIIPQSKDMELSCRDSDDIMNFRRINLKRTGRVCIGSISQLSQTIVSPHPHGAIGLQRCGRIGSGSNLCDTSQSRYCGRPSCNCGRRNRPSQLPFRTLTPSPNGSSGGEDK